MPKTKSKMRQALEPFANLRRPMIDGFGRRIDYVRISVTDRCDLRCRYCMAEHMTFLPRTDLLTFEEIVELTDLFIARGVRKIRLTGGEPLSRRGICDLVDAMGRRIGNGLDELTLTTNGTQLDRFAVRLAQSGIKRINVSLDSRDPAIFRDLTRGGDVNKVFRGIAAARSAGIAIKINMVALASVNEGEIGDMVRWCASEGYDLTLIETMPMGDVDKARSQDFLPLDRVREQLAGQFHMRPSLHSSGGPARYDDLLDLGIRVGFISPMTGNFCAGCNRIRLTATGTVYPCLGQEQEFDLRDALRFGTPQAVNALLDQLLAAKPEGHDFDIHAERPAVARHMNVTGG